MILCLGTLAAEPVVVTVDNFNEVVIDNDKLVLVDFWAPWCGPCREMEPALEEIAEEFRDSLVVAKINVDNERPLSEHMKVRGLPTLILFKNGRPVDRMLGFTSKRDVVRAIEDQGRPNSER